MSEHNKALWTSDRRLYLNNEGEVVEADDPTRVELLIGIGGTLPIADASALGLMTGGKVLGDEAVNNETNNLVSSNPNGAAKAIDPTLNKALNARATKNKAVSPPDSGTDNLNTAGTTGNAGQTPGDNANAGNA